MIGYIKNKEVIVFFWKERYHGSLDQNDREHDIELLITNIDGSINNIAVIVLISHCLETNSTRTYQSTIHNFHFQNPTAAYIKVMKKHAIYTDNYKLHNSKGYQKKMLKDKGTHYGKTDLTFSISRNGWVDLGTPSLIWSFICSELTPGIDPWTT